MKLTIKDSQGNDQGELDVKFPIIEDGKGSQAVHDVVVAYQQQTMADVLGMVMRTEAEAMVRVQPTRAGAEPAVFLLDVH